MAVTRLWSRSSAKLADAHLAAIARSSSDAIVSKDLDGVVRSWNPAAERIFGYSAEEMIGHSIRAIIPPEYDHEEDDILSRVRRGESVIEYETFRICKDGVVIPVLVTVAPIWDGHGRVSGASKIVHDRRSEVQTRLRLSESEDRFRMMADNIPQLAWMADSEGWIFWYNKRWYDYTGTTLEAMQGWGWKAVHHPDHVDRVVAQIQHSWDTGEEWEDTFPLRGHDGEYRWFLSRAIPIRDVTGKVICWFGTNTDITERRRNEKQIELLMHEVNHRAKNMLAIVQAVAQRTAEPGMEDFVEGLQRRIKALATNQDLLIGRDWIGAPIEAIVRQQMGHVIDMDGAQISTDGPEIVAKPAAAEVIGLAVHEMTTNAVKYGALSQDGGSVAVRWSITGGNGEAQFAMSWRETGGPPVSAPEGTGFGTVIMERNPKVALGAEVTLDYAPDGFVWTLRCPLDRVTAR